VEMALFAARFPDIREREERERRERREREK
jgi:hypothetical protein